jgi:glycerol-3-phosphate cytidylyltransferase-like family protein
MCQLRWLGRPLLYTGQTGRTFNIRHNKHVRAIRNSKRNSKYSNHILHTGRKNGNVTNTTGVTNTDKKGKHVNSLYMYTYIYLSSKNNLRMNDTDPDTYN